METSNHEYYVSLEVAKLLKKQDLNGSLIPPIEMVY